jgi:signal transduction histidine kinase
MHNTVDPTANSIATEPHTVALVSQGDEWVIQRDLLNIVLGHTRTALAGNVVIGIVTAIVLVSMRDGVVRDGTALTTVIATTLWFTALAILIALRALHARTLSQRMQQELDDHAIRMAKRQFTLLIGLSGAVWGALPWIGYTGQNAFLDFYTVAMLVGMTSGAANTTLALPQTLRVYLLVSLLPFVVRALLLGGLVNLAGAITVIFTLTFLWVFSHVSHMSLRKTLQVTHENTRLAAALRAERDAGQATMRAKDLFQAGVTHDLRQPVHAIALHLRYLRKLADGEINRTALVENCTVMESALHAISKQLTRLLDLARLESGEIKPTLRELALDVMLEECQRRFKSVATEKGLKFRVVVSKKIDKHANTGPGNDVQTNSERRANPLRVLSDATLLQSMLDNLIANAIRYTEQGGVLIAVRQRHQHVEVQVYDTGPGIEANIIPQLFIAYRRFDDRQVHSDEGYGLGLAIVAKQAELLGHGLQVRSMVGKGSRFSVRVPLTRH